MANEEGSAQHENLHCVATANCSFEKYFPGASGMPKLLGTAHHRVYVAMLERSRCAFEESGCLGMQPKTGGKLHLKLNIGTRPIANKYREGKMKRTFEKRVKKYVKPLKGKRIELAIRPPDSAARASRCARSRSAWTRRVRVRCAVSALLASERQRRLSTGDKDTRKVDPVLAAGC